VRRRRSLINDISFTSAAPLDIGHLDDLRLLREFAPDGSLETSGLAARGWEIPVRQASGAHREPPVPDIKLVEGVGAVHRMLNSAGTLTPARNDAALRLRLPFRRAVTFLLVTAAVVPHGCL
jgi:hypothetical protein